MGVNVVVSVNLFCRDLDRVFEFYRALLQLDEIASKRSPIYRALAASNTAIGFHAPEAVALLQAERWRGTASGAAHYPTFHVAARDAVDAVTLQAATLGGSIHKPPYVTYYDTYQAVLLDPEHNFFRIDFDLHASASSAFGPDATPADLACLHEVIALSRASRDDGRHPFAAMVTANDGTRIAQAMNASAVDPTCHAEVEAVRLAARQAGREALRSATLYSSAEPCAMCAGAIYWSGIGRVAYALSEQALLEFTGANAENPTLSLPCREVFARGQRSIAVVGPVLEAEAAAVHEGFWR
jgi:tRNA(Arg) A34 adenosine deaminase TadA/predicted enzyme related to lactoylglutathione lyase